MEDTWGVRDVPVLSAVVELLGHSYMVTVSDIAQRTGLELAEVARALDAMDPTYLDFRKTETGGDPTFWYVNKVTPEARRAVGQWPTAESLIDRLAKAFGDAAGREQDPERRYQLHQAAGLLGETIRDVAVQVVATIIGPSGGAAPAGDTAPSGAEAPSGAARPPGGAPPGGAPPGGAPSGGAPSGGAPSGSAGPSGGAAPAGGVALPGAAGTEERAG